MRITLIRRRGKPNAYETASYTIRDYDVGILETLKTLDDAHQDAVSAEQQPVALHDSLLPILGQYKCFKVSSFKIFQLLINIVVRQLLLISEIFRKF